MSHQLKIPCVVMRGGTSRGVFLEQDVLPTAAAERDALLLRVMGSPDIRQIDGLGGADVLTSKVAILGDGRPYGADIAYTFGQIAITEASISYAGNCGNLCAAVGVYAIQQGYVAPSEPFTTVTVYNTNSDKILRCIVPVSDGEPDVVGDYAIDGVPGLGAEVRLDFSRTTGATTGRFLPTGSVRDELFVPELDRTVTVSIVDLAKASVFMRATDLGLRGTERPADFTPAMLADIGAVQRAAANQIGQAREGGLPTPVLVAPPQDYECFTGTRVAGSSISFVARRVLFPDGHVHKAFAGTGATCTAAAALTGGTVVAEVAEFSGRPPGHVILGHPSGVFDVRISRDPTGFAEASFSRTARRVMDGFAYVPAPAAPAPA